MTGTFGGHWLFKCPTDVGTAIASKFSRRTDACAPQYYSWREWFRRCSLNFAGNEARGPAPENCLLFYFCKVLDEDHSHFASADGHPPNQWGVTGIKPFNPPSDSLRSRAVFPSKQKQCRIMPLLKKKQFEKVSEPEFLRDDEEVFYCEMTDEIFRDYEWVSSNLHCAFSYYFIHDLTVFVLSWTTCSTGTPNAHLHLLPIHLKWISSPSRTGYVLSLIDLLSQLYRLKSVTNVLLAVNFARELSSVIPWFGRVHSQENQTWHTWKL